MKYLQVIGVSAINFLKSKNHAHHLFFFSEKSKEPKLQSLIPSFVTVLDY